MNRRYLMALSVCFPVLTRIQALIIIFSVSITTEISRQVNQIFEQRLSQQEYEPKFLKSEQVSLLEVVSVFSK